ncbi:DUF4279 domain-containing protein [Rhizobium sophoriradicis]|uniref:DUF4279 domain-containing protein n=1 Tax=Rhizobium TaxID=379 RepID=UPI00019030BB|nr:MULTISPECIES: DUF4279 domain-containing protein [Rhizobium]ARQ56459.1 hypothetical protein Kim5_CH00339 [Rhizobium sp. Kim5]RSB92445.1 DUF4279 domain-containing protein [Rhizobium sophoriradicis]
MTKSENIGSVSIYFHGEDLNPENLTQFLGVEPDAQWKTGDERLLASGATARARTGMWTLSAPLRSYDVSEALAKLVGTLGKNFQNVLSVPGVESGYADIFICISRAQSDAGYTLKLLNSHMSSISQAGLDTQLTVSVDED